MMKLNSELDIKYIIKNDKYMMDILRIARDLKLPDWYIGAGFLRNKVWDEVCQKENSTVTDIDLVYFNKNNLDSELDCKYETILKGISPNVNWEVGNQARMHHKNCDKPYKNSRDAIAHWPETATAVAVRLDGDEIRLLFCYGPEDLLNIVARPTPYFQNEKKPIFYDRINKKNWRENWPKLSIIDK